MARPKYKIILCDYINPLSDLKAQYVVGGAFVLKLSKDGYKIEALGKKNQLLSRYLKQGDCEVVDLSHYTALPGLYDMHFHWVQDDVRQMPKDSLLDWLQNYTWPSEMKFKNKAYSKKKAREFSKKLISCGTFGGACYASIHGHSVDHALERFLGDFVLGNVLMTMNSPKGLIQSEKNALDLIKKKTKKFKNRYALTPRFAPTTSPEVMDKGSLLAKKNNSFIQTHLSETKEEIDYVLSLYQKIQGFENIKSYTEIYEKCGILGRKTIMGHGIHLSDKELKTLKKTKTSIAHCPTSNAPLRQKGLGSGLFDFQKVEKKGINWALGSDIGAGPYLSMFDVMDSFVKQNKKKKNLQATYTKALYRATLKGAEILEKKKESGNFAKAKWGNFVFLPSPKNKELKVEEALKKMISKSEKKRELFDSLVEKTFYRGEEVFSKA